MNRNDFFLDRARLFPVPEDTFMIETSLQFLGATGTVTGSKYLLEIDSKKYLIDCGLFQGLKTLRLRNWKPLTVDPSKIDAVFLTHAHIDHSGYIPLLIKNGFRGKIYCTEPTFGLCSVLLPDSGHLQEEDALYANQKGYSSHKPAAPLYTENDARKSLSFFSPVESNFKIELDERYYAEFFPGGHILGASILQFNISGVRVTFSGDLGRYEDLLLYPPSSLETTDFLIIESTYGNRIHSNKDPHELLEKIVLNSIEKNGCLLISAFAVGRTQQIIKIIYDLKKSGKIPEIPVFLDSPMAIEASRMFCRYSQFHRLTEKECKQIMESIHFTETVEKSMKIAELEGPSIVISASGMATGGRILHHLKRLLPEKKHTVLFTGFQAMGTRGESLIHGTKDVKIHGEWVPVEAKIISIDSLSAHADSGEIIKWISQMKRTPKNIFITHGEPAASEALRIKISRELKQESRIPEYLEKLNLDDFLD